LCGDAVHCDLLAFDFLLSAVNFFLPHPPDVISLSAAYDTASWSP
jgi:hypothetical protein